MKNVVVLLIIFMAVPLAYAHGAKETNEHSDALNPIQADEGSVSKGKAIYEEYYCGKCHGADGKGAIPGAPDLTDHGMMSEMSEGDMFHKITEGVPGTSMPEWKNLLNEKERWHLVNYINTFHHGEEKPHADEEAHMDAPKAEAVEPATYAAAPQKGICGPTALLLIGTLPLIIARRRFFNR